MILSQRFLAAQLLYLIFKSLLQFFFYIRTNQQFIVKPNCIQFLGNRLKMLRHNLKLDMILRGIVMTRGECGATIDEMRTDYFNIFYEPWPLKGQNTNQIVQYLIQIDGLMMEKYDSGLCIWYIDDIGSNISDRDLDSNNNVVTTVVDDSSVTLASLSVNSNEVPINSYAIAPPCIPKRMVSSSFVSEHQQHGVSSTTSDIFIESHENGHNKSGTKRQLSQDSVTVETPLKRMKPVGVNLPLIEKNLDIHNRNSGANSMIKHTTSTEKEVSILVQGDTNGSIDVIDCNEYVGPIREPVAKQLSA